MDNKSVLSIIFSIIMLPANLYCSFWIFRETLNIAGVTFNELQEHFSKTVFSSGRHGLGRRRMAILSYLTGKSHNPEKIRKLFNWYLICTLPGLAALILAEYCALSNNENKLNYVFAGNIILVIINIVLVVIGRLYRKNNPLDKKTAVMLEAKLTKEKKYSSKHRIRNIIVYTLFGAFFISILTVFHLALGSVSNSLHSQVSSANSTQNISFYDVHTVLDKRGFETANIPTTYWFYDENKLKNVVSGIKGNTSFEFYEYSDDETTDGVYNSIAHDIAQDMEFDEYLKYETELSDGGKMFAVTQNGTYLITLYKNNTVIYACSSEDPNEINDILIELGYIKK